MIQYADATGSESTSAVRLEGLPRLHPPHGWERIKEHAQTVRASISIPRETRPGRVVVVELLLLNCVPLVSLIESYSLALGPPARESWKETKSGPYQRGAVFFLQELYTRYSFCFCHWYRLSRDRKGKRIQDWVPSLYGTVSTVWGFA
jgi:hypothetical protein